MSIINIIFALLIVKYLKHFVLISVFAFFSGIISSQEYNYDIPLETIDDSLNLDSLVKLQLLNRHSLKLEDLDIKPQLPATYRDFQHKFLSLKTTNGPIDIGLPKAKPGKTEIDKIISNPLFAVMHPVSFFYYKYNKQEISKRKHLELSTEREDFDNIDKKISRKKLQLWTGITKDEELDKFILFCDFTFNYLRSVSEFDLIVKVKEKHKEFKNYSKPLNLYNKSLYFRKSLYQLT